MKLLYITASMPFGPGEAFLISEAQQLLHLGWQLLVVPRSPSRVLVHRDAEALLPHTLTRGMFSCEVLQTATAEWCNRPRICLRAACDVIGGGSRMQMLKNLCVLPKGIWLGRVARTWGADHIHAHWATTTATVAWIASELTGIPWSMTIHRGDIVDNNQLGRKSQRAQFVRVIAESSLRLAERTVGPFIRSKARLIPMGTDLPVRPASQQARKSHFTAICPASLLPVKGHRHLLEAAARLALRRSDWTLEIAGDGPLRRDLEGQANRLGLANRVRFLGQVPHEDLLARYAGGDVQAAILTSLDLGDGVHEGIPVALMEAMAHGLPVVAFATGGIPELLADGAGLLVRPGDADDLADRWERLITDPGFRQSAGEAGRKRVQERFSVAATAAQLSRCLCCTSAFGSSEESRRAA